MRRVGVVCGSRVSPPVQILDCPDRHPLNREFGVDGVTRDGPTAREVTLIDRERSTSVGFQPFCHSHRQAFHVKHIVLLLGIAVLRALWEATLFWFKPLARPANSHCGHCCNLGPAAGNISVHLGEGEKLPPERSVYSYKRQSL